MNSTLSKEVKDILMDSIETWYDGEGGSGSEISPSEATAKLTVYIQKKMLEFGQWATHHDYTYSPSKKYWVNYEEEENSKTYTDDELYDLYTKQKQG